MLDKTIDAFRALHTEHFYRRAATRQLSIPFMWIETRAGQRFQREMAALMHECADCFKYGLVLSTMVLAGGACERLLKDACTRALRRGRVLTNGHGTGVRRVRDLDRLELGRVIGIARNEGLMPADELILADRLRILRNRAIHRALGENPVRRGGQWAKDFIEGGRRVRIRVPIGEQTGDLRPEDILAHYAMRTLWTLVGRRFEISPDELRNRLGAVS